MPEYNLRDLGPWESAGGGGEEATTTMWVSPDPLHPGAGREIYYTEYDRQYVNDLAQPIYFSGTAPGNAGFPLAEDTAQVGTPREQWERSEAAANAL